MANNKKKLNKKQKKVVRKVQLTLAIILLFLFIGLFGFTYFMPYQAEPILKPIGMEFLLEYSPYYKVEEETPDITPEPTPLPTPTPEPTPVPSEKPVEGGIVENVIYDELQIHFIELGNKYSGDCTYIKAGEYDIIIDAGSRKGSAATIKKYIDQYCTDGILEYVIATHAHEDHIAGFVGNKSGSDYTGILYQYEIETIIQFSYQNTTSGISSDFAAAVKKCKDNGTNVYTAAECWNEENGASRSFSLGEGMSLNIIYNAYYFEKTSEENDYSICTMVTYNEHNFFFTGDLEEKGEEKLVEYYDGSTPEKTLPHVNLFKAGHHGSPTSSNEWLLSKITPDICTVCCCAGSTEYTPNYNNVFPSQEFITRIAKYTDRVYATTMINEETKEFESLNGDIIVSSNGVGIGLSATKNLTKLKDSEWFNETVYVDSNGNICSGKKKEDFFTETTPGVTAVPRRVWPSA